MTVSIYNKIAKTNRKTQIKKVENKKWKKRSQRIIIKFQKREFRRKPIYTKSNCSRKKKKD